MTKPIDFVREKFTEEQLDKLLEKAAFQSLVPIAIEMGLDANKIGNISFKAESLRVLICVQFREFNAQLTFSKKRIKRLQKENEQQRQIVMDFHVEAKTP